MRFAAEIGFAGIQFALARTFPVDVLRRFGAEVEKCGLETGCMIYGPREVMQSPLWARSDPEQRALIRSEMEKAIECAKHIRSRYIAVLGPSEPGIPIAYQRAAFVENLKWAGDLAAAADVMIVLEPINRRVIPHAILAHIADGHAAVQAVDSPHVRLIFDTQHVQIMDGDLFANFEATLPSISMIQIADNPGRTEPGLGEIDMANFLKLVAKHNFRDLVEMEHVWADQTLEAEQRGLAWLRAADADLP